MPKTLVKRGEEYIPGVPLAELVETYRRKYPGKYIDRLRAAVLEWCDMALKEIVRTIGRGFSTVYRRLYRMEREGLECRYNAKSPGRPRLLNPEQERTIKVDLDETPRNIGFERGSWNARMLARHILEQFGVQYSSRSLILPWGLCSVPTCHACACHCVPWPPDNCRFPACWV